MEIREVNLPSSARRNFKQKKVSDCVTSYRLYTKTKDAFLKVFISFTWVEMIVSTWINLEKYKQLGLKFCSECYKE